MEKFLRKSLRFNFIVNTLDGAFFGLGVGFGSFVTILPLFVTQLTDSALLIGLIPTIRGVGWQLPQLLMADRAARATRLKPIVLLMTLNERIPFLVLALVAFGLPVLGNKLALALTLLLLIWQSLGGGFAATAWQSMIAKIIPPEQRGTFFGTQAAAANLLASVGALIAGVLLERIAAPGNFALCFLLTFAAMMISFVCLAVTREPATPAKSVPVRLDAKRLLEILQSDTNFRWFLFMRMLSQVGTMGFAFYTVYVVKHHAASVVMAGAMTSVFMGAQIIANPVMGWLGDHVSTRTVLFIGSVATIASALLAWWSPSAEWFYLVFICAGIANVAIWTITMTMTIDFAPNPHDRPAYIGLSNTLVAPSAFVAPVIGGWLADAAGYSTTFIVSAIGGCLTAFVLYALVRDPRKVRLNVETLVLTEGEPESSN
jgi:MFS family permease